MSVPSPPGQQYGPRQQSHHRIVFFAIGIVVGCVFGFFLFSSPSVGCAAGGAQGKEARVTLPLNVQSVPDHPPSVVRDARIASHPLSFTALSAFIDGSPATAKDMFRIEMLTDDLRSYYFRRTEGPGANVSLLSDDDGRSVLFHPMAAKVLLIRVAGVMHPVAVLKNDESFVVPSRIKRVVVEVGTNEVGEATILARRSEFDDALFVCFEPQAGVYAAALRIFPLKKNLIYIPAAAASGMLSSVQFHAAGHSKCSSLLSINDGTSSKIGSCTVSGSKLTVAVMPLWLLMNVLIPKGLQVPFVMIDAQGFDLNVASSFRQPRDLGPELRRHFPNEATVLPDNFIVECQDFSDPKSFIVQGAYNCATILQCLPEVYGRDTFSLQGCEMQNTRIRENNCLFTRSGRQTVLGQPEWALPAGFNFQAGSAIAFKYPPNHAVCP